MEYLDVVRVMIKLELLSLKAKTVFDLCLQKNITIATAESCTGGLISMAITQIPGSSAVFDRGFITYSNSSKIESIGVDKRIIDRYGAVSSEVARAMAKGALSHSGAEFSLAITGIAGPSGGSKCKPVGTVHIAVLNKNNVINSQKYMFSGDRDDIRLTASLSALELLTFSIKKYHCS